MYVKRPYRQRCESGEVPKKKPPAPEVQDMGERFRQAREALGLNQTHFRDAGVPQDGISKFETGKRGLRLDQFTRLIQQAAKFGMDVRFVVLGPLAASPPAQPLESPAAKAARRSASGRAARASIPTSDSGDEEVDEATGRVRKAKRARAR